MRTVKMTDIIRKAGARTVEILFKPFNLKKWLILIFIGMFAGAMSLGNSHSNNSSSRNKNSQPSGTAQVSQAISNASTAGTAAAGEPAKGPFATPGQAMDQLAKAFQNKIVRIVTIVIVFFVMIFFLLSLWVGCRFKFIWFNAIAANDASVVEPFHRHKSQGSSLFRASLVIAIVFITAFLAVIGWGILNASKAGAFASGFAWSVPVFFQLFTAPIITLVIVLLIAVILSVAIDNFAVMVMALDKIGFMAGIKKVAGIYKSNLGDIILFHFVLLGLVIACAIAAAILAIAVAIVLVLLGLLIFGGGYAILVAAAKMKMVFIVYCIVLGIPFLTVLFIAILCTQLPVAVFLRSFTIEYLLSLGCGYTCDGITKYAALKSPNRSKTAVVVPIILICMLMTVFVAGLLAAIAIPNFIKAREAALNKRADIVSEKYSQNQKM